MRHTHLSVAFVLVTLLVTPSFAQQAMSAGEAAQLRDEIARLRAEVSELRSAVSELRTAGALPAPAAAPVAGEPAALQAPDLAASVGMVQAQVAEHAQTKVESSSKLPVRVFGTILSNTVYNDRETNLIENPTIALRPASTTAEVGTFTSSLRQSRIGLMVDGLKLGESWRASGLIAFDFFGGIPATTTGQVMGLPRLYYAYARLSDEANAVLVGQDEMLLAPRNPTSIAAQCSPLLVRSGNLYLRVPQARYERTFSTGAASRFTVAGGIAAPIAGDLESPLYAFPMPALSGERSRMPAYQARAGWTAGDESSARRIDVGVSAHYGRERQGSLLVDSQAVALDFDVSLGRFGVGAEVFTGENLDQFGGGVGQPSKAEGGFVEARFDLTRRLLLVGGYGFDQVPEGDRLQFSLESNRTGFGSLTYRFTPELAASFEYRHATTRRRTSGDSTNGHFDWALAYSF